MKPTFTALLLLVSVLCFSQNSFRASTYNSFDQLIQLDNNNYVAVGTRSQDVAGVQNILVVTMFTPKGQLISSMNLGQTPSQNFGYSIVKTNDHGFAITGKYMINLILVKFDSTGNKQWQKTYDYFSKYSDQLNGAKLLQLKNNDYCIAGGITNYFGTYGGFLLQTDSAGNMVSLKKYFNYHTDFLSTLSASFIDIAETADGFICLAKTAYNYNGNLVNDTSWLVKINKSGEILWSKFLYRDSFNTNKYYATSIVVSPDNRSYVMAGTMFKKHYNSPTDSFDVNHMFVTKTDTAGNIIWSKTNDTISGDAFVMARIQNSDSDDGYICAGSLSTPNLLADTTYNAILLMKIDKDGNIQWTKTTGERIYKSIPFGSILAYANIEVNNFISTRDEGFLVSANYNNSSPHSNFSPTWLLYKFDSLRQICTETHSYGSLLNLRAGSAADTVSVVNLSDYKNTRSDSLFFYSLGSINVSCSGNYTLPVHLLSFTALQQTNNQIAIEWKTTNEINTDYFVVQRSNILTSFIDLQHVKAGGSNLGVMTYQIVDNNPLPGTSYYRLKQVDRDGKVTYSSIATIRVDNNATIVITPNPAHSVINVRMQSSKADHITLQITDLGGKILALKQVMVTQGMNSITLPVNSLVQGTYILKVLKSDGKIQMMKFVKN